MKYLVDVKDTSYATVEVEARSQEEAEQLAEQAYYDGKIEWEDCDLEYTARLKEQDRGEAR